VVDGVAYALNEAMVVDVCAQTDAAAKTSKASTNGFLISVGYWVSKHPPPIQKTNPNWLVPIKMTLKSVLHQYLTIFIVWNTLSFTFSERK
jgi:hypothetical protein